MASLRSLIARAPGGARRSGGSGQLGSRRISGIAALAAAMLLPAGLGCTGTSISKKKSELAQALHLEKPQPASQMICFWQRRPQHLPDPSRDGIMTPGLVGQVYLLSPNGKPVDVTGDLVVQALDETLRPAGQPAAKPEIWHIDKVTLKKLATKDERFGTCYALFLPWPTGWKDVTKVRMQARYECKGTGGTDIDASDVAMMLEFEAPGAVWNDPNSPNRTPKATGPSEMRGIPDLAKAFKAQPMGASPPPAYAGSYPTTAPPANFPPPNFLPPPAPQGPAGVPAQYTNAGPNGSVVTTKVWTDPVPPPPPLMPQVAGGYVPTVAPPQFQPPQYQQTNYGPPQPLPIGQPNFQVPQLPPQAQPLPLPPAIPNDAARPTYQPSPNGGLPQALPNDAGRTPFQPTPNGGLPSIELPPAPGALQPVVIPRY